LGCPGLEPGTNRLKAEYSTIELATHVIETRMSSYEFVTDISLFIENFRIINNFIVDIKKCIGILTVLQLTDSFKDLL